MTDKLKNIIKEELEKLPKENQDAINALDWASIVEAIGKNSLNENGINNLQVETLLVLIGLEDPNFFVNKIENEVGTTTDEAEKIAEEIVQKIFTPISDILVENIKKSDKVKRAKSEQNLDFILSGGDYSAFVETRETTPETEETIVPIFSIQKENLK
jgi:NAD kinase